MNQNTCLDNYILSSHAPAGHQELHGCALPHLPAAERVVQQRLRVLCAADLPNSEEAQQIVSLIRAVYPNDYPNLRILDPEAIIEDLANGKYLLITLPRDDGRLAGMGALINCSAEPRALGSGGRYYEIGKVAVDPELRNQGLGKMIFERLHELAEDLRCDTLAAFAVTAHPYSQQALSSIGLQVSGAQINDWPAVFATDYRETTLMMTKIINQSVRDLRDSYVPKALLPALQIAYGIFGCTRAIHIANDSAPALDAVATMHTSLPQNGPGSHIVRLDDDPAQTVHFAIPPGCSTVELPHKILTLAATGTEFITARVNIGHPAAIEQILPLLQIGFRYASIIPMSEGDILMLQRPTIMPGMKTIQERIKLTEQTGDNTHRFLRAITFSH